GLGYRVRAEAPPRGERQSHGIRVEEQYAGSVHMQLRARLVEYGVQGHTKVERGGDRHIYGAQRRQPLYLALLLLLRFLALRQLRSGFLIEVRVLLVLLSQRAGGIVHRGIQRSVQEEKPKPYAGPQESVGV